MANDIAGRHLWKLTAAGVILAAGKSLTVRAVVFAPSVAGDDLVLQEYNPDGTLHDVAVLKSGQADVDWVTIPFGPEGVTLNGLVVGTIDGGTCYVYIRAARSRKS